jgi:hypothetical protein
MAYSVDFIYRILDKYTAPLNKMGITQKNFQKHVDKSKAKIRGLGSALTSNVARMIGWTAVIYGAGKAIKTGIQLASDLTEVQNVVDTTFSKSADQINKWSSDALEGFGLSELQAKKFTGTIGAMLKSTGITGKNLVGMSTKLTGLAGDFASFYNLPHEAAFDKIRAGISGETEPLKQLGINMSVANLEAFALTQGITKKFKAMTQAEQVMLRYNYIMKASKDAQGDFAKTLETSYANQIRVLKTRFQEKLANSFKELLPVLVNVLRGMNKFVASIDTKKVSKFIMVIVKMAGVFKKVVKFLSPLLPIIIGIIAAWKAYSLITMIVAAKQMILNAVMTANPIGIVITAIGVLIGLLYLLHKHWDKVSRALVSFGKKSLEVWDTVKGFMMFILPGFTQLVELIRTIAENWEYVKTSFTEKGFIAGIQAIGKAIVSAFIRPIESLLEAAGKIPKIGKWAKDAAAGLKRFREGLFPKTTEDRIDKQNKKTREIIKKTREEAQKPIKMDKLTEATKRSMVQYQEAQMKAREEAQKPIKMDKLTEATKRSMAQYQEAQMKARDQFKFQQMYVSQPADQPTVGGKDTTVNANMNLRVYNETESKIVPMSKGNNLGYNEVR